MPDSIPPLLKVQTGLNPELSQEQVVFEKYIQTRMGNAEANRLYDNGDLYTIYLSSNQSLKKDSISWSKTGIFSSNGIEKIKEISKNSVMDYIADGPHERVNQAIENVNWYFYFGEPVFVQSQSRQWSRSPKFVRELDKALEQYVTSD